MRIVIAGTGYVGLVSGTCLAAKGHNVICIDIKPSIVANINKAIPPIYEEGLEALLQQVITSGHLKAGVDLQVALTDAEGVIIAVGTPNNTQGTIDLTYVLACAREIGAYIKKVDRFLPVIVKSTVVPGTTDTAIKNEIEQASGKKLGQFGLGMNPEFLREGKAVSDFMEPDRIVLGYEDEGTLAFLQALYAPWGCEKLAVNTRTAELIKYTNNALLATQISAVNEIANLAAAMGGIDVQDVMRGVYLDKRWNPSIDGQRVNPEILAYLVPGCGFGGSCFPKDVQALHAHGDQLGLPMAMMKAVLSVNDTQPLEVIAGLKKVVGDLAGQRCLVLGLAFKPETDDVRESASLRIISALLDHKAQVSAHDPVAVKNFATALGPRSNGITYVSDWKSAAATAEVIIIATKWPEYSALSTLGLQGKIIFDARRLLKKEDLPFARYLSIGYNGHATRSPLKVR